MFKLDLIQTVTFAGLVLFLGYRIRALIPPLARYNIPAAVIGGMLSSVLFSAVQTTEDSRCSALTQRCRLH